MAGPHAVRRCEAARHHALLRPLLFLLVLILATSLLPAPCKARARPRRCAVGGGRASGGADLTITGFRCASRSTDALPYAIRPRLPGCVFCLLCSGRAAARAHLRVKLAISMPDGRQKTAARTRISFSVSGGQSGTCQRGVVRGNKAVCGLVCGPGQLDCCKECFGSEHQLSWSSPLD